MLIAACRGEPGRPQRTGGLRGQASAQKPLVVASVYPIAYLARRAAGPVARVTELSRPGAEPHDAELSAGQVRAVGEADLVLYLGGDFQPAVERAVSVLGDRAIDLLPEARSVSDEAHPGKDAVHHPDGAGGAEKHEDPHVWLDPRRMQAMNSKVAGLIARLDPRGSGSVRIRAAETDADLKQLDEGFEQGLARCRRRQIVTGHGAFGYLAGRYGLEQLTIGAGLSENEPSPRRMAALAIRARALGTTTVFYETASSPASARTLAGEIGARPTLLDSVETAPSTGDYLSVMRHNLTAIKKGLGCS